VSLFGRKSILGLDIGSTMIKAAELRKQNGRVVMERAAVAAMPAGAFSGGLILDLPAMTACVRDFCKDQGLRTRQVAFAVEGDDVFLARVKLQKGSEENLRAQICQETARLAPFPISGASVDYHVLDAPADSGWLDVLVVAAARAKIRRMQDLLRRAGKIPVLADSTACALANAFDFNYQPAPAEVTALVHLGPAMMTVCIVRGSVPLVAKDLPLALPHFTEEEWSLTDRIAVHLERVFELMDDIADEHPLEPRSSEIRRLVLSGGAAHLRGLNEVLQDRIQIPFEEMNPLRKLPYEGSDPLSRLIWDNVHCLPVAVGLALRGCDEL
jgi:type IV pilus assembly protein PilM